MNQEPLFYGESKRFRTLDNSDTKQSVKGFADGSTQGLLFPTSQQQTLWQKLLSSVPFHQTTTDDTWHDLARNSVVVFLELTDEGTRRLRFQHRLD